MEKRKPLIFILLSFGITWACWIPAIIIAEKYGYQLPMPANYDRILGVTYENSHHAFVSFLFIFAVYGPVIAAFVTTFLEKGKQGVIELLRRITKWRVSIRWYFVIVGVAIIIVLIPKLIGMVFGITEGQLIAIGSLQIILVLFLHQVLTSGIGEEPGWRGYLQPYLQSHYNVNKTIWVLGIIWAVWHYPFTIYYSLLGISGIPLIGIVITLIMTLLGQTISLVGITYIYAWVYNNTKSVLIAIMFHALSNLMYLIAFSEADQALGILAAVMPWIIVFLLKTVYGKESFPGKLKEYKH